MNKTNTISRLHIIAVTKKEKEGAAFSAGGNAVAQWLEDNMQEYVEQAWQGGNSPESVINDAFLEADKTLLAPKKGIFGGMGERGIGGSKCGATGALQSILCLKFRARTLYEITAGLGARTMRGCKIS